MLSNSLILTKSKLREFAILNNPALSSRPILLPIDPNWFPNGVPITVKCHARQAIRTIHMIPIVLTMILRQVVTMNVNFGA